MLNSKNKAQYLTRKFVNHLMINGKKEKAEKIFLESLNYIYKKEKKEGMATFFRALENSKPLVEVRSVRRGGATYQVPVPLQEKRSLSLGMKWLIDAARKKGGSASLNLCLTLLEASKNQGDCVKKRESLHIVALKNRSFTHFRWF
ncbi:30S ribosomal protein S7 (mitochondrion) [Nannochloropsis oceanica]|uniref:30S ribosomal protein S7 n=2 Tax=Nannochloropsis TaxID=5748 RepID=T1R8A6_9STRA|nr:30S ribosomal protein S7 [Nannochloropsis oculata]AGI48894.1 30S ribosomal protein S7 [Nannochloropsis oceanica]AGI49035.1 30S ribosomal protein S7 [Nannochloropsis oculata]